MKAMLLFLVTTVFLLYVTAFAMKAHAENLQNCDETSFNKRTEFECYRSLAEQGSAEAQFILGTMYLGGQGVSQNDAQTLAWYRKAADQGHAAALYFLGTMYAAGQSVPQDDAQAIIWYRKAAAQGHKAAQLELEWIYNHGRGISHSK